MWGWNVVDKQISKSVPRYPRYDNRGRRERGTIGVNDQPRRSGSKDHENGARSPVFHGNGQMMFYNSQFRIA